jgi:hypothetical protein
VADVLIPAVSVKLFSTYNCIAYDFDDETSRWFMLESPSVICGDNAEYSHTTAVATLLMLIWPIGATAACAWLLVSSRQAIQSRKPTALSRACSFLHREMEPEYANTTRHSCHPSQSRPLLPPCPPSLGLCYRHALPVSASATAMPLSTPQRAHLPTLAHRPRRQASPSP